MKQIIHVNQHKIRKNLKTGSNLPVLTSKTYKNNVYAHAIDLEVSGKIIGRFVYSADNPLSCGARVWFECYSEDVKLLHEVHS